MKFCILSMLLVLFGFLRTDAQPEKIPYLGDRPGIFEILNRTDYSSNLTFTKADLTANMERIKEPVAIVRQNPVLYDIRGFMGRARVYDISGTARCVYGVPARVSFEFCDYRYSKGKISYNTIEPPEWSVFINNISGYWNQFNMNKCMFTTPFNKKTIVPGIDVYDNYTYVIYDPSRPTYWVPVTVGEAIEAAWLEALKKKDEAGAKYIIEYLEQEWAAFSTDDLRKPAYFGGGISRVSASSGYEGQENMFPPIVEANPGYWNKNLPKSAIRFIVLTISMDKEYLQKESENCLKYQYNGET